VCFYTLCNNMKYQVEDHDRFDSLPPDKILML
jgi:hypothetical protein